jgi:hypothetical protein
MTTSICEEWKIWRELKTEAFQYLIDFVFLQWDLNEANNFQEFRPKDIIFRHYHCAKGIFGHWEEKEAYSFSLNSFLWFDGRVYPHNFQFFQEEQDLFIKNCTINLANNGVYTIYQDFINCDNVFCRFEDLYLK